MKLDSIKLAQSQAQADKAIQILTKAYEGAPNIQWLFRANQENLKVFFSYFVKEAQIKQGLYLSKSEGGVLIAYPQKARALSFSLFRMKAQIVFGLLGMKTSIKATRLQKFQSALRPKKGWYGFALGIDPDQNAWKTRMELKKGLTDLSTQIHEPIYVETTHPRILKLYTSLGFSLYHEVDHPYANLRIYYLELKKVKD